MSDPADQADDQVEAFTKTAMSRKQPEGPKYTGFCANCGEPVESPKRWCNAECREDHQVRVARGLDA
ncbi:MAG: hypothetical protein NHG36_10385 [Chromatiaceae bacterium]|nr:hypothetical protein [Candidatus Thioaporhodococcus sediminis]